MAIVSAFTLAGVRLWFNSHDHWPPHFHASKTGGWEIRVFFLECTPEELVFELKWPPRGAGPGRKLRKELLREILAHREALLEEWDAKVHVREDF